MSITIEYIRKYKYIKTEEYLHHIHKKYEINIILYIIACYIHRHTIYTEDNPNNTHR